MGSVSLLDPKYMGGLDGAGGYRFEDSYLLSKLPDWLSFPDLKAFQQEGWSDVELFFESDRRRLIQIKDHRIEIGELRDIVRDFSEREAASPGRYEQYTVASAGLARSGEQIRRQLERLRAATYYTEPELAPTRAQIVSKLERFKMGDLADFIIEKVFFDSDNAWVKDENRLRAVFTGSLVSRYEIRPESAEDLFLRTARLLTVERGKPVELSVFQEAIKRKQLEDQSVTLTQFDLITPQFLERCRPDKTRSSFYDGARPNWSDIVHHRDIPREITGEIVSRVKQWDAGKLLVPVLAEAGEGKSTFLRRIAVELADENKIVLYHRRDAPTADAKEVERVAEMTGQCVYVCVDDAPRVQNFGGFVTSLSELPFPIVVIAASRPYEWNPLRSVYSANIELGLATNEREYALEGLTDREMELLFRRLTDEGLIRPLSEEDLRLAIEHYGKTTKRKLLVLVLELTRGKRVKEVVRDELERVREMGEGIFSAYRYICLMASVRSFITVPMLERLVNVNNIELDIIGRLPGLVEMIGGRVYSRHDRIGEIATDLLFEGADEQRGNLLCQLISLAFEEGQLDVVKPMVRVSRSIPQSQLYKVADRLVDEAYCAGAFDLFEAVMEELVLELDSQDIGRVLLAAKTPLIWERMVFPPPRHVMRLHWDQAPKIWDVSFSWPQCAAAGENQPAASSSLEAGLRWAELFSMAARFMTEPRGFFDVIAELMYVSLEGLYRDRYAEIGFHHAEFLRATGRDEDAVRLYHSVLEENLHHAQAHLGLALSLYFIEDHDGAWRHYKTARELDRESVFRLVETDVFKEMLERLGELEELIEYRRDSVKFNFPGVRRLAESLHIGNVSCILRIAVLKVPETPKERFMWDSKKLLEEQIATYSEESEQSALIDLEGFLELVRTLSPAQRDELGTRLYGPRFGELRRRSSPDESIGEQLSDQADGTDTST